MPGRRGHPSDTECLLEERILADTFYGLEVVLALAQQSKIGPDQVDMGYAVAQGDGLEALFQPTVAIDDGAGYHQAGMGGVDFRVALLEDECHWQFTPWVKS